MKQINQITTFNNKKIRRHWDDKKEKWYFSVVDIIATLTDSINPTDYLKKLRKRDFELGDYIGTNCPQVEMTRETEKRNMQNMHTAIKDVRKIGQLKLEKNIFCL